MEAGGGGRYTVGSTANTAGGVKIMRPIQREDVYSCQKAFLFSLFLGWGGGVEFKNKYTYRNKRENHVQVPTVIYIFFYNCL